MGVTSSVTKIYKHIRKKYIKTLKTTHRISKQCANAVNNKYNEIHSKKYMTQNMQGEAITRMTSWLNLAFVCMLTTVMFMISMLEQQHMTRICIFTAEEDLPMPYENQLNFLLLSMKKLIYSADVAFLTDTSNLHSWTCKSSEGRLGARARSLSSEDTNTPHKVLFYIEWQSLLSIYKSYTRSKLRLCFLS